jgi:hypothetical protein
VAALAAGTALARPVPITERESVRRVVLADRSRAAAPAVVRAAVLAAVRPGDVVLPFDAVPHAPLVLPPAPADTAAVRRLVDSALAAPAAPPAGAARASSAAGTGAATATGPGSLSAALVAARRLAPALAADTDSLELVLVSPLAAEEADAATARIRGAWGGRARVLRVGAPPAAGAAGAPAAARRRAIALRGAPPDDALARRARARRSAHRDGRDDATVRVVRTALDDADRSWLRGAPGSAERVLVDWPADGVPAGTRPSPTPDTAMALVADGAAAVAPFVRRAALDVAPGGRVVARWADGRPAAVELAEAGGCVRRVAVAVPQVGDAALRAGFRALLPALVGACGGRRDLAPLPPAAVATLAGGGRLLRSGAAPRGDRPADPRPARRRAPRRGGAGARRRAAGARARRAACRRRAGGDGRRRRHAAGARSRQRAGHAGAGGMTAPPTLPPAPAAPAPGALAPLAAAPLAADAAATAHARAVAAGRVAATRRALGAVAAVRAGLWAAAAGVGAATAARLADVAPAGWAAGVALAAGGAASALAGARRAWAPAGVALWIEARVPALGHALVTLVDAPPGSRPAGDPTPLPAPVARALAARVAAARWDDVVTRAARRAVLPPAAALAAALLLATVVNARPVRTPGAAVVAPGAARGGATATLPAADDPLARVRVTVTPPAYAGQPARSLDAPAGVAALVGSVLVVEGAGDGTRVRAALEAPAAAGTVVPGRATPVVRRAGGGWRTTLAMPASAAVLRLTGPARARLIVLEPRADLPPRVTLDLPARDTVLRAAAGTLPLRARADDDLALADGAFEWVVSSGEGENFTFRSGRAGAATLGGARATLAAGLNLAALALKPGDVLHVRAVARDRRPGAAPGASETRAVRVARPGEYDSVAVEGAPPPAADTTALGQRMLLQLTEALVARQRARRAPLAPEAVAAESRRIGADQARLRRRVGDAVFARAGGPGEEAGAEHAHFEGDGHSHGPGEQLPQLTPEQMVAAASRAAGVGAAGAAESESPVVAVNRPLLEAYNHMWDAGRALEIAEPAAAIAPMRRAIAALQRARAAERVYLRGRPPAVVVDVEKVRLAGRVSGDTLAPAARAAGRGLYAALDPAARGRVLALDRALLALARGGRAAADAVDSLALLRVRALGEAPTLAAALGDALAALARGGDASAALARARRAAGAPAAPGGPVGGVAAWGAPWADLRP